MLKDSLVAPAKALCIILFSAAQLTVVKPDYEQIPAAIVITPNLRLLHLQQHSPMHE